MPGIQLTNNTSLNITASSADGNATLNRYLKSPLTFLTPAGFESLAGTKVQDLDSNAFPIVAAVTGKSQFAVEGTFLDVELGVSASLGLHTGDSESDFLGSLQIPGDPAVAGVVSFGLEGKLSVGDVTKTGDFCFGIARGTTVGLTSFSKAAGADTFASAVERAIAALTIPHDVDDFKSLPVNTICQITAASSLKFTASVTYNVLNDPLATASISILPSIAINATAGATIEGTATHTSEHAVTIAKMPDGRLHLSVSLTKTDDLETSLTVSAGLTAQVGTQDAITFLLGKISPNFTTELAKIKADVPPAQYQELSHDIKAAIDASLCNALQASLKVALDDTKSNNRVFLYEIDLTALDGNSTAALQSALRGDFTTITRPGALAGIRELDSALTITSKVTHSLAVHLLGIFNGGSVNTFIRKSKVDYTKDTHEIVLSDETIKVVTNNLNAEKLREAVLKGITLTLPASANTPEAKTPITMVFFDRQASTSPSTMRQFANALKSTGAPNAATAESLLGRELNHYGISSLYLGLKLTPPQCRQLFIAGDGQPYNQASYIQAACRAEGMILTGDKDNADRLKLFTMGAGFWKQLETAASPPNIISLLEAEKIRKNALVDVVTVLWWSSAMATYAQAVAAGQPLVEAGKEVVKDSTLGFSEPWLVFAAWSMLGEPPIVSLFTSSLLKQAIGAGI